MKPVEILNLIKKDSQYKELINGENEGIFLSIISEILKIPHSEIYNYNYLIFKDSQDISKQLLSFLNSNKSKSQVEKIMLTVIESKRNFLNKVKFILSRKELDDFVVAQIKDVHSDLLFESNKFRLIKGKNERLFYIFIVLNFLTDYLNIAHYLEKEIFQELKEILKSTGDILINNNFHLDSLIIKNKSVMKSFTDYVQTISLNLYKDILTISLNLSLNVSNKDMPENIAIKLRAIEIVKEMAWKKIDEFYNSDNIKILKSIFNEKNDNESFKKISKIKSDMSVFKNSIDILIQQIEIKSNELKELDNDEDFMFIDGIIKEADKIKENLINISEEISYKINTVYSKY